MTRGRRPGGTHDDPHTWPLFDFNPERAEAVELLPLQHRIWTEHKARLVERYLYYFIQITKHGTYIDGFAGRQYADLPEAWAAQLVLETRPRWMRDLFLCELDATKVRALEEMVAGQPPRERGESKRTVKVIPGDFNLTVDQVLASGRIKDKTSTFCLLDQHTFECQWRTVQRLARHKSPGAPKIELFYFLGTKWLHRAISGLEDPAKVTAWWGRDDWTQIEHAGVQSICDTMRVRFEQELGYRHVKPWPIFETSEGQSVMYYMIHASDHREAPMLMRRAYEKALVGRETAEQFAMDLESGDYLGSG